MDLKVYMDLNFQNILHKLDFLLGAAFNRFPNILEF